VLQSIENGGKELEYERRKGKGETPATITFETIEWK
jgi:hypothetical protein